ncbi:MAG: hydantoinase B/oxoprolinase family protein [Candidatus Bipolaricaulota bacterium]
MMKDAVLIDPITLEVLRHALATVAEEMNANLIRTAYSPNIKERHDCSCAIFDRHGKMAAQAESIPVHLGAMPFSVAEAIHRISTFHPGDVIVLNDPYFGGAHLPDITFIAPVFVEGKLFAFVACRAHHADIGGKEPGSVAGDTTEIYQEGLRIPPISLWREGHLDQDLVDLILLNVRTPQERMGDLRDQHDACETGIERMQALATSLGAGLLSGGMEAIMAYSERRMRAEIARLPRGTATYEDFLDGDGITNDPIRIVAKVTIRGKTVQVDFTGTAPVTAGPVNAVYAVTASATYFTIRALTDPEIPPNAGCYLPIKIVAPPNTVVNANPPAPVVGGNLETSQRIVDVLLGAFAQLCPRRVIAACQGTMNNLTIGGVNPGTGEPYTLYETIAGGFGARPNMDGVDGVHSHMTNTFNTPVEALEIAYPLRVERYELISGSGGKGRFRGGLGIRRDITVIGHTARVSLLADRRQTQPYGLNGGEPGKAGENVLIRSGKEIPLPGKGAVTLHAGETVSLRTPGGGGYGTAAERDKGAIERDRREGRMC